MNQPPGPCFYCHRPMNLHRDSDRQKTKDHTLPRSQGGKVIVWACKRCNNAKAAHPFDLFNLFGIEVLQKHALLRRSPTWAVARAFDAFVTGLRLRHIE